MIKSILEVVNRAQSGKGEMGPVMAGEPSGLTRADFLRVAAIGGMAFGLTACKAMAAGSLGQIEPVSDLDKIYDVWQSRFNAADIEGMVDLYVDDVTYVNPEGKPRNGRVGVRADFLEAFEFKPQIDIHDRKHLVYRDIVLTTNHWTMTLQNADGTKQTLTGGGIEVMQKQADGAWRYIIDDASRSAS